MPATSYVPNVRSTQGQAPPAWTNDYESTVAAGDHTLVRLAGPGLFVCASVVCQLGEGQDPSGNVIGVTLQLDGRVVESSTFVGAKNVGFDKPNNFGLTVSQSGHLWLMTMGYPLPLQFERELLLRVHVIRERMAVYMTGRVIHSGGTVGGKEPVESNSPPGEVQNTLHELAGKLAKTKSVRDGHIVFKFTDGKPEHFVLSSRGGSVTLGQDLPDEEPLIEVIGRRAGIIPVLTGKKDGLRQFATGGFHVVADLQYLNQLCQELQFIRKPIPSEPKG